MPYSTIRVARVVKWTGTEQHHVAARTIHGIDFSLPPGKTKIVKPGKPGLTERWSATRKPTEHCINTCSSRILRKPQTRVIAEGVGTYAAIADFAQRGLQKTSYIAVFRDEHGRNGIHRTMRADAAGYTATGYRAGHGIVAVDPHVIPLGTKLYIPGYGFAIAGDTGGAIVGNRIDLGFNSISDAMQFGRRTVKVYTLH